MRTPAGAGDVWRRHPELAPSHAGIAGEALVRIRVSLEHEAAEDRDELDDLGFEFAALWGREVDVEIEVSIEGGPLPAPLAIERWVYARKEATPPDPAATD